MFVSDHYTDKIITLEILKKVVCNLREDNDLWARENPFKDVYELSLFVKESIYAFLRTIADVSPVKSMVLESVGSPGLSELREIDKCVERASEYLSEMCWDPSWTEEESSARIICYYVNSPSVFLSGESFSKKLIDYLSSVNDFWPKREGEMFRFLERAFSLSDVVDLLLKIEFTRISEIPQS